MLLQGVRSRPKQSPEPPEIASSAFGLLAMTAENNEFRSLLGGLAMRH
jgi:hypothetical protein